MKQLLSIITALFLMLAVIGCGSSAGTNADTDTAPKQETAAAPKTAPGKTLVVYFSGTGRTEALAKNAANVLGADVFEIQPAEPYTSEDLNYANLVARATREQNDTTARPKIANNIENFDQ